MAVFAAIGALSHQQERAFSASLIYLGLGVGAAAAIELSASGVDPIGDDKLYERAAELAVIVALFGTGLKLDASCLARLGRRRAAAADRDAADDRRRRGLRHAGHGPVAGRGDRARRDRWRRPTRCSPATSASDRPATRTSSEPSFSITGEAGLNDGLAFPFVLLGVILAGSERQGWLADWLLEDVLYPIVVGVAIGAALGYGIAAAAVRLRDRGCWTPSSTAGWRSPRCW